MRRGGDFRYSHAFQFTNAFLCVVFQFIIWWDSRYPFPPDQKYIRIAAMAKKRGLLVFGDASLYTRRPDGRPLTFIDVFPNAEVVQDKLKVSQVQSWKPATVFFGITIKEVTGFNILISKNKSHSDCIYCKTKERKEIVERFKYLGSTNQNINSAQLNVQEITFWHEHYIL